MTICLRLSACLYVQFAPRDQPCSLGDIYRLGISSVAAHLRLHALAEALSLLPNLATATSTRVRDQCKPRSARTLSVYPTAKALSRIESICPPIRPSHCAILLGQSRQSLTWPLPMEVRRGPDGDGMKRNMLGQLMSPTFFRTGTTYFTKDFLCTEQVTTLFEG